ncbi:hypothetical protein SUGI_0131270 [Cryptomeria japonica]|nr:hypothetical protein SUGI_0131270 [Cryptomeria japonica]
MALRIAVLKHMRVAVNPAGSVAFRTLGWGPWSNAMRWMSSETFLDKDEVTERVLSVVKSFPKVDPSKSDINAFSDAFSQRISENIS